VSDGLAAASVAPGPPVTDVVDERPFPDHRIGCRAGTAVVGRAVLQVLPAWIVARVVVGAALLVARTGATTLRPHDPVAVQKAHQGLLGWDAGWYSAIAAHGYAAAGEQSVRFFPLFPLLGRMVGAIPGVSIGVALVLVSNLSALLAMAGLWMLVRHDLGDADLARRSVWLLALAPSAYSLVLAYSDATLLLCSVVTFLGARTGRWWWAAAAGLAAGADRPVGVLLVVPVAVEVWSGRRQGAGWSGWVARGAAVVAPAVGAGAFLAWVGHRFADAWLPFTVQQQSGHRGQFAVPISAMWHDVDSALHGHHLGSAVHVPWVVVCVALAVVAWMRLPRSYALFATAVLLVSLTSTNLDSFERYALAGFPLVVAASLHTASRRVELVVLVASGLAMGAYATLAFLGMVVP
jgi:Mannosyltransferase (PIG-V)